MPAPSPTLSNTSENPPLKKCHACLWAIIFLAAFWLATGPIWLPTFMHDNDVDYAWSMALYKAHMQGLTFGDQIIFTYGPLGYLCTPSYLPSGFSLAILLRALIALWAAIAAPILVFHASPSAPPSPRWPRIAGLILLAFAPLHSIVYDPFVWLLPLLLLLLELPAQSTPLTRPLRVLGLALLAILSLGKFTTLIMAVPLVGIMLTNRALFNPKRLWEPLVFPLALLATWILTGQPLSNFPLFIQSCLQCSLAHSTANGYPFFAADCIGPLAGLLSLAIVAWLTWQSPFEAPALRRTLVALGCAGLAFIAYKAGIVRAGPATMSTIAFTLMLASMALALAKPQPTPLKRLAPPGLAALAIALFVSAGIFVCQPGQPDWWGRLASMLYYRANAIVYLARQPDLYQAIFAQQSQALAQKYPLPPDLHGKTTDLIDLNQQLLLLWDVRYSPRPSVQDYFAGSPWLINHNKGFFESPQAPQQVFLNLARIDRRFPLLAQGPSFLPLLSRYTPLGNWSGYTILALKPQPSGIVLEPLTQIHVIPGQDIQLPAESGLLWARLHYTPPFTARVWNFLHRTPRLRILAQLPQGLLVDATGSPGQMASGFLLSPIPQDGAVDQLWTSDPSQLRSRRVITLNISWEAPEWIVSLFDADMVLDLYQVRQAPSQ